MSEDRPSKTPSASPSALTSALPDTESPTGDPSTVSSLDSSRPLSARSSRQQTLIGITASVPPTPAAFASVPPSSTSLPNVKPSSCPPPTLDGEEESWDAAFEAANSGPPTAMEAEPKSEAPASEGNVSAPVEPKSEAKGLPEEVGSGAVSATPTDAPKANKPAPAVPERTVDVPEAVQEQRRSAGSRVGLFMVAAVTLGGAWFFLNATGKPPVEPPTSEPSAAFEPPQPELKPASSASAAATEVPAAPAGAPSAPSATEPTPNSDALIVVTVTASPPDARFYYKGKPVGRSPLRVELKPGERRSFELGQTGFNTRKVVVDGTKRELTVALRPKG